MILVELLAIIVPNISSTSSFSKCTVNVLAFKLEPTMVNVTLSVFVNVYADLAD